jgi:hypothetical protein
MTPKPLFIRAAEHLGTLQIDMRKKEISPQYNRSPWTTIDYQQHAFELGVIVPGSNNQGFHAEKNRILKEKYKRHTKIFTERRKRSRIRRSMGETNDKKEDTPTELNI